MSKFAFDVRGSRKFFSLDREKNTKEVAFNKEGAKMI